jgi:hypothetical protein
MTLNNSTKNTKILYFYLSLLLPEKEGFEPTYILLYKDLAGLHFKPLSHFSLIYTDFKLCLRKSITN